MSRFRRTRLAISDVVAVAVISGTAAVAVYINSLHGRMVFDDFPAIVNNPDVTGRESLALLFDNNFWGQRMDAPDAQHQSYRPITTLTFRLNHVLHELRPEGYHLVNVALHMIATILFVFMAAHVASQPTKSYLSLAGLLFATHPIHTEAVSGLVGRADVLASVFFLAALLLYCEACASKPLARQLAFTVATVLAIGVSVLCKETGITAVAVATVYDVFINCQLDLRVMFGFNPVLGHQVSKELSAQSVAEQQKRSPQAMAEEHGTRELPPGSFGLRHRRVPEKGARGTGINAEPEAKVTALSRSRSSNIMRNQFVLRTIFLWVGCGLVLRTRLRINAVDIQVDEKTNPSNHIKDPIFRMLTKNLYTALHAWLLVYPKDLCCDWAGGSIGLVESYSDLRIWGIVTLYCAIAALIYEGLFASTHRRWRAELLVGLALLVVPFVPATGLFMEVGFVLAERILYIPSMGFCLLVAGAVNRVSFPTGFRWQSQAGAVMIFVLFLYSARTVVRNQDWLDEVSLFGSGVRVAPNNAKLHHNYAYYSEDRVKEFHLREAIRLYPPYISAYTNLGVQLSRSGRSSEAIEVYKLGLKMHRKYTLYSTDVGIIYHNMAQSYLNIGLHDRALEAYQDCLKAKPSDSRCKQFASNLKSMPKQAKKNTQGKASDAFDNVPKVTDGGFEAFRKDNPQSFIMFYAPWCSHCNEMKGEYSKLWTKVAGHVGVASVDCTKETAVCGRIKVSGYPQLMYFSSTNDAGMQYSAERTAVAMAKFLEEKAGFKAGTRSQRPAKSTQSKAAPARTGFDALTKVTVATSRYFRRKHDNRVVMFYAPWCTHCTDLKPLYAQAAAVATEVAFATVDCTVEEALCQEEAVAAYPTLKHYRSADSTSARVYQGEKSSDGIVRFVRNEQSVEASFGTDAVAELTADSFRHAQQSENAMLVMWHAPWCSHCQEAKPAFGEAAKNLRQAQSRVTLASVDCTAHAGLCSEMEIAAYPTFLGIGSDQGKPSKYDGPRDTASFIAEATRLQRIRGG